MRIKFWGATQTTTGSFHLLEHAGQKIALDCGLFQGRRSEFYERNKEFPCPPSEVQALILSHAHVDHCGNIPNFVAQGFRGDIFSTGASVDLAKALILDSAHIQEKDAAFVNKKRARKDQEPVQPLYTVQQAEACFGQFRPVSYYKFTAFHEPFCGKFLDAGHILGSAQVELDIDLGNARRHRLVFSGDIGRGKRDILRDPEIPSDVETLIMESTYGNRATAPVERLREELLAIVKRVSSRGGKIIIPAFSVGRTQDIVFQLNVLFNEGLLPRIPIFVDSPLSTNVTEIFRKHPECYNRETRDLLLKDSDPFGFGSLTYIREVEESMKLNDFAGPCVIIAASGMCEAGRILHHLRNSISNPKNCVLIVGFQAENTLGRRIVERQPKVRIFGEEHALNCEVKVLNGFSAHADMNELRDYVFRVNERSAGLLKRVFLVHGEPDATQAMVEYIKSNLGIEAHAPNRGDVFDL